MSDTAIWLIAALVLLGTEMMVGSIYLLAVFLAAVAAAALAALGASFTAQLITAGITVTAGGIAAYIFRRHLRALNRIKEADSNNLDRGQRVEVKDVKEDGTASVTYRGTVWQAYDEQGPLSRGFYTVKKVDGPRLSLTRKS